MRILFLTNFYLPYGLGGEEESCQQMDLLPWRHSLTLVQYYPSPVMLLHFYYWLQEAYRFQAYQEGLREFQPVGTQG